MSCRVMGRGAEDSMDYILDEAKEAGITKIKTEYISKNMPNFGFKKEDEYWVCYPHIPAKSTKHIELIVER